MKSGHMSFWLWRKIQTSFFFFLAQLKVIFKKIQIYCLGAVLMVNVVHWTDRTI